jgi:GT2 family glycosyltransferase
MAATEAASVAVVLVSYHTGPALFECLDALRRETAIAEIALVDNGNDAETRARLEVWPDARLRLICGQRNVGFARGCHLGVTATASPFLLLLNPDCLLAPGAIAALQTALATESRPWIATVRLLEADGREQRGCRRAAGSPLNFLIEGFGLGRVFPQYRLNHHQQPLPSGLTATPALSGAFMLMPRTTWDATGGLDTGYFLHVEDLDLCARLRRIGGACWFLPAPAVGGGKAQARRPLALLPPLVSPALGLAGARVVGARGGDWGAVGVEAALGALAPRLSPKFRSQGALQQARNINIGVDAGEKDTKTGWGDFCFA